MGVTEQKHCHEITRSAIFVICMLVVLAGCSDEITHANQNIRTSNPAPVVDVVNDKGDGSGHLIRSDDGFMNKFRYEGVRDLSNPWLLEPAMNNKSLRSHDKQPIGAGKLQQDNPWLSSGAAVTGVGINNRSPSGFEGRSSPWGSSASLKQYRQQKDKPIWTRSGARDDGWEDFPVEDSFWRVVPNGGSPEADKSGSIW